MFSNPLKQIKSDDPRKRADAAKSLGSSRDVREAVAALAGALGDPNIDVRRAAATALGELGDPSGIVVLLGALWDRTSFLQYEASAALVKIGLPVVAYLVGALASPDPAVRSISAELFTKITGQPAPLVLTTDTSQVRIQKRSQEARETDEGPDERPGVWHADPGNRPPVQAEAEEEEELDERGAPVGPAPVVLPPATEIFKLIEIISRNDPRSSAPAAKLLCESPDPKAWEALVALDITWDKQVAQFTATALAKLCRLGDVRPMQEQVARKVLLRLADVPGDHALGVFRGALSHISPNMRSIARQILDSLGAGPETDDERRFIAMDCNDWDALKKLGAGGVPELLIGQLKSDDERDREHAVEKLGKVGDGRGVIPLIEALKDRDEGVRGKAAAALAALGDKSAVEPLILRLRDQDDWVRTWVIDALAMFGDQRAIVPVSRALKDMQKSVRRAAARALAKIGGAETVAGLGEAMGDTDVEIRRTAAQALAKIDTDAAVQALAAAMADEDDQVRAFAAQGLARTRADDKENDYGQNAALISGMHSTGRSTRKAAIEALEKRGWEPADDEQRAAAWVAKENVLTAEQYGEAAVPAMCVALMDGGHYYLCQTAAECLGRILDTRATPALCKALNESTDMTIRGAAAKALGQIRDPASRQALTQALENEHDKWVKPYIEAAIKKVGDANQDRLVSALEDEDPKVRTRAAILLMQRGDPRRSETLDAIMRGRDVMMRGKAIDALKQTGGPDAVAKLIGLVNGPGFDAPSQAISALVAIGEQSVRPMVQAVLKMEHNAAWLTFQGLAEIGPPAMVALCGALPTASKQIKKIACERLGGMCNSEGLKHKPVEPLVLLLEDDDKEVRRSAAHGLDLLKWEPADDAQRAALEKAKKW